MVEWRKNIDFDGLPTERIKSGIYRLSYRGVGFDFDSEARKIKGRGLVVVLTESRKMLLSRLLDEQGVCVERDVLCGDFWGEISLDLARPRLSNLIHFTRKDLAKIHEEIPFSLGYEDGDKKVRWNVVMC